MSQRSLREFLQHINSLPSARGLLSTLVPSSAIASANREVEQVLREQLPTSSQTHSKRGPYRKYSPELRAQIAKYACSNGLKRASEYFSRKLGKNVSITTINSMKKSYLIEKKKADPCVEIATLPFNKRGRPYLLGERLDQQVQAYIRILREQGGIVTASIVVAAAKGIIMATNSSLLRDFGGHIHLNCHWVYTLLDRMKFARRKATTSKSKTPPDEFARIKVFI